MYLNIFVYNRVLIYVSQILHLNSEFAFVFFRTLLPKYFFITYICAININVIKQ